MSSRIEDLIAALLNGEQVRFDPHSRMEAYFLSCIASAGTEGLPTPISRLDILLYQLADVISSGGSIVVDEETQTYMLVTSDGTEIPAVLVDEQTVFTATENDIREGMVAATEKGVTTGTKEIPSYYTSEGIAVVTAGSSFDIYIPEKDRYDYTKIRVIICPWNGSIDSSVSAEKVGIDGHVYEVNSSEALSSIGVNHETKRIVLGIVNEGTTPYIIRYFSYKEEP